MRITLRVNGAEQAVDVSPNETLLHVLREKLGLTGSKEGCGTGDCGACTVMVDGRAVNSCLMLAVEADGSDVVTIEGLMKNGRLNALQQAFVEEHAVQCGFCIPGVIMVSSSYLLENPTPSKEEITKAISGNICRCGGYQFIIEAVSKASKNPPGH